MMSVGCIPALFEPIDDGMKHGSRPVPARPATLKEPCGAPDGGRTATSSGKHSLNGTMSPGRSSTSPWVIVFSSLMSCLLRVVAAEICMMRLSRCCHFWCMMMSMPSVDFAWLRVTTSDDRLWAVMWAAISL